MARLVPPPATSGPNTATAGEVTEGRRRSRSRLTWWRPGPVRQRRRSVSIGGTVRGCTRPPHAAIATRYPGSDARKHGRITASRTQRRSLLVRAGRRPRPVLPRTEGPSRQLARVIGWDQAGRRRDRAPTMSADPLILPRQARQGQPGLSGSRGGQGRGVAGRSSRGRPRSGQAWSSSILTCLDRPRVDRAPVGPIIRAARLRRPAVRRYKYEGTITTGHYSSRALYGIAYGNRRATSGSPGARRDYSHRRLTDDISKFGIDSDEHVRASRRLRRSQTRLGARPPDPRTRSDLARVPQGRGTLLRLAVRTASTGCRSAASHVRPSASSGSSIHKPRGEHAQPDDGVQPGSLTLVTLAVLFERPMPRR